MKLSPEDQLICRAAEGLRLAEGSTDESVKKSAVELFESIVLMSERKQLQIEVLMQINEALCQAVKEGDAVKVSQIRLSSPLPVPIKL